MKNIIYTTTTSSMWNTTSPPYTLQMSILYHPILSTTGLPQDAMRMLNHTAHVLIPPRLAALLEATPQLVADASTAFHYRDVDAMMAFAQHRVFGMPSNAQDLVMASVRFNRVQYAQLAMQRFEAPKVCDECWHC